MVRLSLSEIATYIDAQLVGQDRIVEQAYTDTRQTSNAGLFVALKGENFDAHHFLSEVEQQGAEAVLVEQQTDLNISQLVVKNTRLALGKLAQLNKQKCYLKSIAITGSSGKTTVKEMVAAILSSVGKTHATQGNYNNDIGVPLTLLQLNQDYDYAVVELGANQPDDIQYTVDLVKPDVALVNNVSASHLQGLGDLQGIAREKGKVFLGLKPDGIAIINNDDKFADFWKQSINNKTITFSIQDEAKENNSDLIARNIKLDENYCPEFEVYYQDQVELIKLPLVGKHHVNNALAAMACCLALEVSLGDIVKGLLNSPQIKGRLIVHRLINNCQLIDDTYNANLGSVGAAIELLSEYSGKRIFVLGDMGELGSFSQKAHEEVGELANQKSIDRLYTYGELSAFSQQAFQGEGKHFSEKKLLIDKLSEEVKIDTTFLIKGSRRMRMEDVVTSLKQAFGNDEVLTIQERIH